MSERNGHRGAHWSKAASVAEEGEQKQHATHSPYDLTSGLVSSQVLYNPGPGRGGPPGAAGGGPLHSDPITASYARFQAPSIHHASVPPPSTSTSFSHPALATSAISNVPGFVPPTLPATPTSVLTPNPFAVTVSSIVGGGGICGAASSNAFRLDQFQQFELSKIMNAMNPAAAASLASTAVAAAAAAPAMSLALGSAAAATVVAPPPQLSQHANNRQQSEGPPPANSGIISSTITENVLNAISGATTNITADNVAPVHGRLLGLGVRVPDEDKMRRIQSVVESGVSDNAKQQILQILDRISTLKPVEKLLLYLRLPGEAPETDPLRHPQNPLGTRSEINHTINWVRSHLEHDPQVSIPKQDVYNDYLSYCCGLDIKPLSTADFGKVMKQVFPGIRPRRLGTRGHSRYCYAAMRKTTKLTAPQLPALNNSTVATAAGASDGNTEFMPPHEADTESWDVVKTWAESLLHVKVENVGELAARIKLNNNSSVAVGVGTPMPGSARGTAAHKKYAPREPKEKRFLADMGPLKKRRKKKRKGSSSSESSCNQQSQANSSNSNINNNIDDTSKRLVSPNATPGYADGCSMEVTSQEQEHEHKSMKMVRVKEEILDSPTYARVQQLPATPHLQQATTTTLPENYMNHHQQLQQQLQQQQTLPMNLATEQRSVLTKAPPSMRMPTTAVKNLTPKIMKMSHTTAALSAATALQQQQIPAIKEEVTDEYNTTNIFCKKVRKAQQTKGFWQNSPTPVITTTASSPPTVATSVIAASNRCGHTQQQNAADAGASSNYVMGPPATAQLTHTHNSTTPTVSAATLEAAHNSTAITVGRVTSRNMLQLRLKKQLLLQQQQQQANETASGSADIGGDNKDAAYLPDNLGLPRERVISICNMDKHELDDYFPPILAGQGEDEEDNSQDQDTELLQYFQTGDAEEKLNSLDDAAKLRNPTAAQMQQMPTTNTSGYGHSQQEKNRAPSKVEGGSATQQKTCTAAAVSVLSSGRVGGSVAAAEVRNASAAATLSANAAVGSASASLALMSQKHQQQQLLQQQQQQRINNNSNHNNMSTNNINGNKRKIQLNASTTINFEEMTPARKNCIFLPISPNTNNSGGGTAVHVAYNNNSSNVSDSGGFFASPGGVGVARLRPKATFCKQQSLDFDAGSEGSDPMICATRRRRRSYVSEIPNNYSCSNSTSASAPPSPSVLQQQQQQLYGTHQLLGSHWATSLLNTNHTHSSAYSNAAAALLNEQNSLDLDLFGAVTGAGVSGTNYGPNTTLALEAADEDCHLAPLGSETQRSQSVPLSQLQRMHSPTFNRSGFLQSAAYSACTSVAQTPVPPEFVESTLFSENSNSQQSVAGGQAATTAIKLEVAGVLASDSTAMLDEVDVSDILASPDFVTKFSSIAQVHTATTTTCSSAGSSSGYSSVGGAGTNFGSGVSFTTMGSMCGGGGSGIVSRSVPSTPLPHHHQNLFGHNQSFFGRSRTHNNDELLLSPTAVSSSSAYTTTFGTASKYCANGGSMNAARRSTCDMSKSMPTTPITTPCFRYSPTEYTRDFLINGNTIDSINSFGTENLMGGGTSVSGVTGALIDEDGPGADADLVGSEFLGDL